MKTKISTCFWFNGVANDAAQFYCSIFPSAQLLSENAIVTTFYAFDQTFTCLNGRVDFPINPSISIFINFSSLEELEFVWEKLSQDGNILMPLDKYDWSLKYGWVQDKFGITWQLSFESAREIKQIAVPSLLFVGENFCRAKEALDFYTGIFFTSEIENISFQKDNSSDDRVAIKHAQFSLIGYRLKIMESNLKHNFTFNEGVSLIVYCDNQNEIDHYWESLTSGGKENMCGWLQDKYGVCWQIIPSILPELMADQKRSKNVMQAFMKMKKFDIATLLNA